MLNPEKYLDFLIKNKIDFFTGVPDSLLKQFCACITDKCDSKNHVISANEGGAIGLGIGHYIGSKKIPLIYLQNSGLGNIINPLISLASNEVYGIPMVIMIGWRGEPGVKDEPQHVHQGRVMIDSLIAMDIPFVILDKNENKALDQTKSIFDKAKDEERPVAIIVQKNTFNEYSAQKKEGDLGLSRENAIKEIAKFFDENACVVCTTGMASRELFEHRASTNEGHHKDFLTVGGMGHANQIALGLAKTDPNRIVYCIDGDGAALMHMGSLAIIGQSNNKNFVHILLNNGVHDSVGGQPTVGLDIDFSNIATAVGYPSILKINSKEEIEDVIKNIQLNKGPYFIEIKIKPGNRKDIGRPTKTPYENKEAIMNFIHKNNNF